jgi:hypothetical protein
MSQWDPSTQLIYANKNVKRERERILVALISNVSIWYCQCFWILAILIECSAISFLVLPVFFKKKPKTTGMTEKLRNQSRLEDMKYRWRLDAIVILHCILSRGKKRDRKHTIRHQAQWFMLVIPVLRKLRQPGLYIEILFFVFFFF